MNIEYRPAYGWRVSELLVGEVLQVHDGTLFTAQKLVEKVDEQSLVELFPENLLEPEVGERIEVLIT